MAAVAIIGSGLVGSAWAISFARVGHDIRLWDQDPSACEGAKKYIAGVLDDLAANDLLHGATPKDVLTRISIVSASSFESNAGQKPPSSATPCSFPASFMSSPAAR